MNAPRRPFALVAPAGDGSGMAAFLLLLAVATAVRALALGDPIVHSDEQFYFALAHGWLRGALPYVDIWDRKPIGLFLLYAPAAALRDPMAGVVAYQSTALLAAAATAWLVAALARAAGWRRGALLAAVLYLLWLDLADGQGGQAPVFYNAPMALAALLIARGGERRAAGVGAMALVGLALQIKYSVVFEGAWFGVWLLWRDRGCRWRGRVAYAGALILAAGLPSLVAAGAYVAIGQGRAWWFANVASILLRSAAPATEAWANFGTCAAILLVPVGLALRGRGSAADVAGEPAAPGFVRGWLVAALAGFMAFGTWFDHYTLPVLVPAWVAAAAMLGRGWWRWALVAAATLGGQASLLAARASRGTPAQFARLVEAVGQRQPGCLYVYSGPSMLYPFTGRCRASRFVYPSHLTRTRESGAIGAAPAAELRRLFATHPPVVVIGRPFRGEEPTTRRLVERSLDDGYRLAAVRPLGRDRLGVYTRR